MANEVYQFQVKNAEGQYENVTLGKGASARDAFISFNEVATEAAKTTISGFAYFTCTVRSTGETIQVIFPVTSAFNVTNYQNILNSIATDQKPWPIFSGYLSNGSVPLIGFVAGSAIKDATGQAHQLVSTGTTHIEFVWFKNYF